MAGSSSYPTSVDNKTALTDGVDIIQADDVNDAYVPIDAIQTFVGASGATQSKNTDILSFLMAHLPTIKLKFVDVDTVQASAGSLPCQNSGASIRVLRKNTSTTNITFANIDTGARATNTDYYVFAIADASASTVTFKISTSASTPASSTNYLLVGGFSTNSTGSGEIIESTVWSVAGMKVSDVQYEFTTARATTTTNFPADNSIPQNTEGLEVASIDVFVKKTTNIYLLIGIAHCSYASSAVIGSGFFSSKNGTPANAIAAGSGGYLTTNETGIAVLMTMRVESSVGKCTYAYRAGADGSSTFAINSNGSTGSAPYGAISGSGMVVIEFEKGV